MRIAIRIKQNSPDHTKVDMWVNGGLSTGLCGITLRNSEVIDFIFHLKPDAIDVDRESINLELYKKLENMDKVCFI